MVINLERTRISFFDLADSAMLRLGCQEQGGARDKPHSMSEDAPTLTVTEPGVKSVRNLSVVRKPLNPDRDLDLPPVSPDAAQERARQALVAPFGKTSPVYWL